MILYYWRTRRVKSLSLRPFLKVQVGLSSTLWWTFMYFMMDFHISRGGPSWVEHFPPSTCDTRYLYLKKKSQSTSLFWKTSRRLGEHIKTVIQDAGNLVQELKRITSDQQMVFILQNWYKPKFGKKSRIFKTERGKPRQKAKIIKTKKN